jgi:pimeloyl-ACP methyl ester carboxylesterase
VTQKLQTRCGTLEYAISGQSRPAIVLFNGAGLTLEGWRALYPCIEELGTVVAWNRFGVEGSDPPGRMQRGAVVVASVRELLHYTGVEPPYVLVGHSLGALYADLFARLHPDETAGLLMLERADPNRVERMDRDGLVRSLSKVQDAPEQSFRENLDAEVAAIHHLEQELESAGPIPCVPFESLTSRRGHFPQATEPERVLDALARVVKRARQASPSLPVQP